MQPLNPSLVKGETFTLTRPKSLGQAQEIDPRNSSGTFSAGGYTTIPIPLEKVFWQGFPLYSTDLNRDQYVIDYSTVCADSIGLSVDNYFYNKCFRDYSAIPASGQVSYAGKYPPLQLVFAEDSSGNLKTFDRNLMIWGNQTLNKVEVPQSNRYSLISPDAAGVFLQNAPTDTGENYVGAMAGGVSLLTQGISGFISRYNFMLGESNAITGQAKVADLGDGAATCVVSAYVADTTIFLDGEMASSTPLGAVKATLSVTAALNSGIAVGKIARLGADAGAAKAYGIILRVSGKDVWFVPYSPNGVKLTAAQLSTSTDKFGIPQITSVNAGYHSEFIAYLNPPIASPVSRDAVAESSSYQGMSVHVAFGNYDIRNFSEGASCGWFGGCTPSDYRKAVLMLSA
jgi:hypothetical protein